MKTYTCDLCHREFPSSWTDEEALDEMHEAFGHVPEEERGVVCDDCYTMLMAVVDHRSQAGPVQ